jgi:hypothetical protein
VKQTPETSPLTLTFSPKGERVKYLKNQEDKYTVGLAILIQMVYSLACSNNLAGHYWGED